MLLSAGALAKCNSSDQRSYPFLEVMDEKWRC